MTEYTIRKYYNYGIISPVPEGSLTITLSDYLSYEKQGIEFMPNPEWGTVRLYNPKKGTFPWGLLRVVERILTKYCLTTGNTYKTLNKPQIHITEDVSVPTLRNYQNDAVNTLLKNGGGVLCMPTGSGKTITIIEYLKIINLPSIVIVPTLDIKKQWENHNLPNLVVSTYQNPKLKDKDYVAKFKCYVFDEAHHVSAKSIYGIAMKTTTDTILIGCSATLTREDGEDMKIKAALGEIVYTIPRKELIEKGWLANAEVFYLTPRFKQLQGYFNYQEIYNLQIVNNEYRNKLIIQTALQEYMDGRKVLILVTQVDHGEILLGLVDTFIMEGIPPRVVFMNGKSKDRNRDMNQYDIIIATQIYDEGYDLPSLDCLILAAGGKSSIKLTQRIGRVLRIKPDGRMAKIYDFVDAIKYLKSHYVKRRKILENEFIVTNINDLDEWVN